MTILDECYAFRGAMVARLERDLIGPDTVDELLDDLPLERYIVGILYPRTDEPIDPAQDDQQPDGEDSDSVPDPPVAMASARYPSSAGLTFAVDLRRTKSIDVAVQAALYAPEERGESEAWRRKPLAIEPVTVTVDRAVDHRKALGEGLELYVRVRAADKDGAVAVTLALINTRAATPGKKDADAFFQPSIASRRRTASAAFVERHATQTVEIDDADLRSYDLLYRDAKTFAAGHGCSVDWTREPGATAPGESSTTFVPRHALRLADSNPDITRPHCRCNGSRRRRATSSRDLTQFCRPVRRWIADQETAAADADGDCKRSRANTSPAAARRSSGSGRASMCSTRPHRLGGVPARQQGDVEPARARAWIRDGKPSAEPDTGGAHEWRPFQLAFILQCLDGIVDPDAPRPARSPTCSGSRPAAARPRPTSA